MTENRFIITCSCIAAALLLAACGDDGRPMDTGAADSSMGDGGDAMVSCPSGTEECDGACVDLDTNRANCGGCGAACGAGELCVSGACELSCPTGQVECDGGCISTDTDRRHCGGCGTACGDGQICTGGSCEISCPAGQTVCGGECVDTDSDPDHCSACDAACGAGQVCSAAACVGSCAAGLTECSDACVDTDTSPLHCGGCDMACAGATGASGLCISGACVLACDAFSGDCNGDLGTGAGDGCETGLETDVANCGACRRVCGLANAVNGCSAGACTITSCDTGFDDCDGMTGNGCEADVTDDVLNCGACGTVCGAGEGCFDGICASTGGESCTDAIPLVSGANTVYWTATVADYITSSPACASSFSTDGPDVVMSYTATGDESVAISIAKPSSTRWAMLFSTEACGTTTSASCESEFSAASLDGSIVVPAGETVYIYLIDTTSGSAPLDFPLMVNITPTAIPCLPGSGGIIGTTQARVTTGLTSSFSEYYVASDQSATGYVYVGGTSDLYRIPKAGGIVEDVATLAGLGTNSLGYAMLIDGDDIYTIESTTTGRTGIVYRISTDAGATWNREEYVVFPVEPSDDIRAATVYGGRIYFVTEEDSSGVETEIWSAQAGAATPPVAASLELQVTGEGDCSGIARDSLYYYLACDDGGDRLVRVPIAGGASELITSTFSVASTANAVYGDDTDADDVFDVLYFHGEREEAYFVCDPSSMTPFGDALGSFGTSTFSNYGMGFDENNGVLWLFDDDVREFVSFQ